MRSTDCGLGTWQGPSVNSGVDQAEMNPEAYPERSKPPTLLPHGRESGCLTQCHEQLPRTRGCSELPPKIGEFY